MQNKDNILLTITDAEYIRDYVLRLTFNTGEKKFCNFLPLAKDGVCKKLKSLDYFKNYTLDPFTLDWNNEIGFAPEYLYDISTEG